MILRENLILTQEEGETAKNFMNAVESIEKQGYTYALGYSIDNDKKLSEAILCKTCIICQEEKETPIKKDMSQILKVVR